LAAKLNRANDGRFRHMASSASMAVSAAL